MVKPRRRREMNLVKAKGQNWYIQVTIDFLTLLDTKQIQENDNKKTARMLHLWHYFIQDPKAPQANQIANDSFYSNLISSFLQICRYKSIFAIKNPQNSVWLMTNWLIAQPKSCDSCPRWHFVHLVTSRWGGLWDHPHEQHLPSHFVFLDVFAAPSVAGKHDRQCWKRSGQSRGIKTGQASFLSRYYKCVKKMC